MPLCLALTEIITPVETFALFNGSVNDKVGVSFDLNEVFKSVLHL